MNFKKMISVALVLAITITLLPIKYGVKVHAAITGYTTYNSDNTDIPNKYGITGTIYATKKYSDLTAVVSGNSLYIIRNGVAEAYNIDSTSQNFSTSFSFLKREGNKLYIYEYSYDNPKLIIFDIDSKTFKTEPVSGYFVNDGANGRYIREAVIDNNGVQWYMASEQTSSRTNKTLLTQVNIDKSLKQYDLTNVSGQFGLNRISTDSNNNLWMVTTPDVSGAMAAYENIKTTCLSKFNNGQITVFHQFTEDNGIFAYKITPSGDVWLLIGLYPNGRYSGVKMEHLSSSGSVLGDYSVSENVRDINLDSHGGVWISDGQHIMKFENNQFVTKYTLTDNRSDFDVLDDNNISANSSVGITLINSGQMENVNKDSFVKDNAYVVKDNLGNIKLLSKSDYVYVNDVSNGKFSQPKKVPELSGINLRTARGNNGSIYLYNNNQIFKYDGTSAYVYSQLNLQSDEDIESMEMTTTGEIYIQTNKNLIMIDKNKNVSSVDIISGLKLDNTAEFLFNTKLIVDKNNNMYFQLYYKVGYNYSTKLYKINNLSAIENVTPAVGTMEYENAFNNENNDLEYVFSATYPNLYFGAYYYGADGTLVEDSRFIGMSNTISSDSRNLKKVEKTSDNKLIIYAYSDNIYVKDLNSQTIVKQSSFTNGTLAADERGGVYVGGYSSNGLLYFYPSDMRTTINISGIAHLGIYTEVTPNITATNGDVRKILIDDKPFVNGTKYAVNGYHVMNIEVRDYKGDTMQEVLGFTIDLTPPTIDINGAEDGGVYSQTHFNVYTTDSDGKITNVLLNGQPYNGEEISTPGDYTINASAIDNLGNKSERTIKFYIRANASQINNAGDQIISNPSNTDPASTVEVVGGTTTSTDGGSTIVKVDEDKALDTIFDARALVGKLRGGKVSQNILDALSNIIISATQSSGTNKIEVPISSNLITKAGDADLGILFKLGNVNLQIPDGAVNISDYDKDSVFDISKQDINGDEAANMLKSKPSMLNQVGNIFNFGITVNQSGKETAAIHQFSNGKKVAVTIELTADQLKNVDVSRLSAYYFNETTNKWEEVGGTFDKATNKFTFETTHFSKYTLMEKSGTLPKTGQLIDMNMLIISGIAIMLAGCLLIMKKRKTN